MKRTTLLLLTILVLSGCVSKSVRTVHLDQAPLSKNEATVIIYHDQGFKDSFRVRIDGELVGIVTHDKPLKLSVRPGNHELNADPAAFYVCDRGAEESFKAGKVHYIRLWVDTGFFVNSLRFESVANKKSYAYKKRGF